MLNFLVIIAGLGCGLVLGILFHEAGHVVFARLGAVPISRVVIGLGPLLLRKPIGSIQLELHAVPVAGFVQPVSYENASRPGMLLFILGGAIGNVVLIGVVAIVYGLVPLSPLAALVFAMQILLIVMTLFPGRYRLHGMSVASDGLQIAQLLYRRHPLDAYRAYDAYYDVLLRRYQPTSTVQTSGAMPLMASQIARQDKYTNEWARRDVLPVLQRHLDSGTLAPAEEMLALDCLLTTGLITGDPEYRHRLAAWARRTAELGPDIVTLTGSRGATLIELGDFAAGKMLLDSVAATSTDANDRAITSAFLARAEAGLGDMVAARHHLDAARRAVDAGETLAWVRPLIARVARKLDGGGDQSAA